jgi:ribosomal protein S12 methylthiotransferase
MVYGCAKNQVDAEEMAARLRDAGYRLSADPAEANVLVVHTCGFIEDARRESVEGILLACQAAEETAASSGGKAPPVVVTGCLSQRYPKDLVDEIPEIAGVAGTAAPRDIVEIVGAALSGRRLQDVGSPGRGAPGAGTARAARVALTPGASWAYLRVSEGCRHRCTYCAIPSMRGTLASREPDDVLNEAKTLAAEGVKELDLIAQDLSDYGYDLAGERRLAPLVRSLVSIPEIAWVRLLYVRPDGVTSELGDAMALPKVAPYVDLPVEHGSAKVLRLMGRPGPDRILEAVETLRASVPGLFIRTTVIAGFPGETEKDVEDTLGLLKAMGVHRVGVFSYSREEGTSAYGLPDPVPPEAARERTELIRRFGLVLAKESSESLVGMDIPVLLAKPSVRPGYWIGRGPHQAPEVDGRTYVKIADVAPGIPAESFVTATIKRAGVLSLFASRR